MAKAEKPEDRWENGLNAFDPFAVRLATMNPIEQAEAIQAFKREKSATIREIAAQIFGDSTFTQKVHLRLILLRCTKEERDKVAAGKMGVAKALERLKKREVAIGAVENDDVLPSRHIPAPVPWKFFTVVVNGIDPLSKNEYPSEGARDARAAELFKEDTGDVVVVILLTVMSDGTVETETLQRYSA